MRHGTLGATLSVTMVAVLALGLGVVQAAPIPNVTFDTTSSAAACFNLCLGGPQPLDAVLNLTYTGSTWGGVTSGGVLGVGGGANNLGSLTLGTGGASYAGNSLLLEVTFVLSPPANVLPEDTPQFTASLTGAVSGTGEGGILVDFNNTPQAFSYTLPGETGSFSFTVNDLSISAGQTLAVSGTVFGASSTQVPPDGNGVPEPGVTLLLGSVLAALAFVGRRIASSR